MRGAANASESSENRLYDGPRAVESFGVARLEAVVLRLEGHDAGVRADPGLFSTSKCLEAAPKGI